jgi:hypothetical protein
MEQAIIDDFDSECERLELFAESVDRDLGVSAQG